MAAAATAPTEGPRVLQAGFGSAIANGESRERVTTTVDEDRRKSRQDIIDAGWDPKKEVLILKGMENCGKTKWALSQSSTNKAYLINCMEALKTIPDNCDLLVFDGLVFGEGRHALDRNDMKTLVDMDHPRSLWRPYKNVTMPTVPRIFCINEHDTLFGTDPLVGANLSVTRRCFEWDVDKEWGSCYHAGTEDMKLLVNYPILEVGLVLVEKRDYGDQFGCMVVCPTCGHVNEHGLGVVTLGNWGHRACSGRSVDCGGYKLAPASKIQHAGPKEWRKLTRPMDKKRTQDFRSLSKKNRGITKQ